MSPLLIRRVPVGPVISTITAVVAVVLSLPIESKAFTEIELLPSDKAVRVHDHVVDVGYVTVPTVAVEQVTTIVEASVDLVPVKV